MNVSKLSKFIAAGVIATSVAVVPLNSPASAQTNTVPNTTTDTVPRQGVYETRRDNDFDWGWLGLLGLLGLAGLAGRKREEPTRYRDPNEVDTTTYRP